MRSEPDFTVRNEDDPESCWASEDSMAAFTRHLDHLREHGVIDPLDHPGETHDS